jgi:serine phosphatase RsbU (regulator of sigma subunit)
LIAEMRGTLSAGAGDTAAVAASPALLDPALAIVLVEDDAGDALLVQDMLSEVAPGLSLTWVRSVAEARAALTDRTRCVLLDLQLPDATGFTALDAVQEAAPHAAVVVLTGFADGARGVQALARGAQDYLNKSQVEPELLARTVRYAIERRVAQDTARELAETRVRAAENTRLERGLLPKALLQDDAVKVLARYRPGRHRALLGGDFYDVVQRPDGTVYAMIGDVSGHGPDEAALGVCLRIAWRALVLAGVEEERILPLAAEVLEHERAHDEVFATACMLRIADDQRSARVYLAGHPMPILFGEKVPEAPVGLPLGVLPGAVWEATEIALPRAWRLMLYTDGLIEGAAGDGERLGVDGLRRLLAEVDAACEEPARWVAALIARVEDLNAGPLSDDLAVLVLDHASPDPPGPDSLVPR